MDDTRPETFGDSAFEPVSLDNWFDLLKKAERKISLRDSENFKTTKLNYLNEVTQRTARTGIRNIFLNN